MAARIAEERTPAWLARAFGRVLGSARDTQVLRAGVAVDEDIGGVCYLDTHALAVTDEYAAVSRDLCG